MHPHQKSAVAIAASLALNAAFLSSNLAETKAEIECGSLVHSTSKPSTNSPSSLIRSNGAFEILRQS